MAWITQTRAVQAQDPAWGDPRSRSPMLKNREKGGPLPLAPFPSLSCHVLGGRGTYFYYKRGAAWFGTTNSVLLDSGGQGCPIARNTCQQCAGPRACACVDLRTLHAWIFLNVKINLCNRPQNAGMCCGRLAVRRRGCRQPWLGVPWQNVPRIPHVQMDLSRRADMHGMARGLEAVHEACLQEACDAAWRLYPHLGHAVKLLSSVFSSSHMSTVDFTETCSTTRTTS